MPEHDVQFTWHKVIMMNTEKDVQKGLFLDVLHGYFLVKDIIQSDVNSPAQERDTH